jgi:hypothetical protein
MPPGGAALGGGTSPPPRRGDLSSQRAVRGEHAVTNRQDCRFAQPQAAPQGRGTGRCRVKPVLQPATLQVGRELLLHVARQVATPLSERGEEGRVVAIDEPIEEVSPPGGGARSTAHRSVAGHGRRPFPQPSHAQGGMASHLSALSGVKGSREPKLLQSGRLTPSPPDPVAYSPAKTACGWAMFPLTKDTRPADPTHGTDTTPRPRRSALYMASDDAHIVAAFT